MSYEGKLSNKIAVVTGGARGIGFSIANELLKEGANVILTDLESQLLINHNEKRSGYTCIPLDVSNEKNWDKLVDELSRKFGKVDILVNNAGIGGKEGVMGTSIEQWNQILAVNLTGAFLGMQKFIPLLKKVSTSSIINISSIYGKIGNGEAAAYHAAKSGLIGLTKTAAVELASYSIRVNTIHPGVIDTPMIKRKLENPEIKKSLDEYTLLPRLGTPYDIARSVVFLASDDAQFITGTELVVDGGYLTH